MAAKRLCWTTALTIPVVEMHEVLSQARFEQEVAALPAATCSARGWKIHKAVYPVLDVEFEVRDGDERPGLRLRLDCSDWDEAPPSIFLLRPDGSEVLSLMPPKTGTSVFHAGPHPSTGRPFVCMRGSREYHTHPSHTADLWENIKGTSGYDLGGIITRVWRAWQKDRP